MFSPSVVSLSASLGFLQAALSGKLSASGFCGVDGELTMHGDSTTASLGMTSPVVVFVCGATVNVKTSSLRLSDCW